MSLLILPSSVLLVADGRGTSWDWLVAVVSTIYVVPATLIICGCAGWSVKNTFGSIVALKRCPGGGGAMEEGGSMFLLSFGAVLL